MNVNLFCIKYMHKILQKPNDFRFLMITGCKDGSRQGRALTFVQSLFRKRSVNKSNQMLYIKYVYIFIFSLLFLL